ncbi:MAG: L,D-transpeptidase [Clostridiaceae bacterium]
MKKKIIICALTITVTSLLLFVIFFDFNNHEEMAKENTYLKYNVQSSIVYGTIKDKTDKFKKGEQVKILEDFENGSKYKVSNSSISDWIDGDSILIDTEPKKTTQDLSPSEKVFFVNDINLTSKTNYLIWIDISRQKLNIFNKSDNTWALKYSWDCSTGYNITPTVIGEFEINSKGISFKNQFGQSAMYYSVFYNNYMIHSIPTQAGKEIENFTLGERASNGCIILSTDHAKWVYSNIPMETKVFTY